MIEIGIVGAKNSGKTTLIEALLPQFISRGIKVATIKHTGHNHSFDSGGKDSFRHRQAGAGLTMAISQSEIGIFATPDEDFINIAKEIISKHFDICLVEGNKQSDRPSLFLTRNIDNIKGTIPKNIFVSYGEKRFSEEIENVKLNDVDILTDLIIKRLVIDMKENLNE